MLSVSKEAVRRLQLWKQGLYHTPTDSTKEDALALLKRLGCVQLDTMNVLTRSQHLIFWSRMQHFEEQWLLDFYQQSEIFELYLHALCILPMDEYAFAGPFHHARMVQFQKQDTDPMRQLKADILQLVETEGTITSKVVNEKLGLERAKVGTWERTPVRKALDELWHTGQIGVTRSKSFQKVYHRLTDQIPAEQLGQKASAEEMHRRYTKLALQAMGVANEADVSDYFRFRRGVVREMLQAFLAEGSLCEVEVEGETDRYYVLREDLETLQSPALREEPTHSTFLSPFDNLIWFRPRLEKIFGVYFRLESYLPEEHRVHGYFALPILVRGKIIGTIDLKAERKSQSLVINRFVLFAEDSFDLQVEECARVLQRLLLFLGLKRMEAAEGQEGVEAVRLLLNQIHQQR